MIEDNKIIGEPKLLNTKIRFMGKGNILYCEKNITIKDSYIEFKGNNSIVYLNENRHIYYFKVTIYNNSVLYFGKNNYINKVLYIILSEQKHVIIGDEGLFAIGCWIRTADPHIIYDESTRTRINKSKSIYIGDHVWLGQEVLVLKGSRLGSGCIMAARGIAAGKEYHSNTVYGGNPAKCLKEKVFHSKKSVNTFTTHDAEKYDEFIDDRYIYKKKRTEESKFDKIEKDLELIEDSDNRMVYLKERLSGIEFSDHDRFFIGN